MVILIPIIHEGIADLVHNSINYDYGIFKAVDCIECKTSEQLNGKFTLSMKYPIGGHGWNELIPGRLIIAKTSETDMDPTQPFTITKVVKQGTQLTIQAEHISYRLSGILVPPMTDGISALTDLRDFINNNAVNNPFVFYSDSYTAIAEPLKSDKPQSIYSLMYGGSNSITKAFAGMYEIRFNRLNVAFQTARGTSKPLVIKYGINMLDFTQQAELSTSANRIWPYALLPKNADDKTKTYIDLTTVGASAVVSYGQLGAVAVATPADVTDQFAEGTYYDDLMATALTRTQTRNRLQSYAAKWAQKNETPAGDAFTVKYIDLAKTADYNFLEPKQIGLGDIIRVKNERFGVDVEQEITAVTYDVLRDRNDSITIGTPSKTVIDKLAAKLREGESS